MKACFLKADILLPRDEEAAQVWPVVACDQFTSQPDYWHKAEELVGDRPSSLNIVFPEVYLEEGPGRIERIGRYIDRYLREGVLTQRVEDGFVLVERITQSGIRPGIVGKVDLEQYDFSPDSKAPVRATEDTVRERIPPRVKIRKAAAVESPHIMLLADDKEGELVEALYEKRESLPLLYDLELMLGGGRLRGWAVTGEEARRVQELIMAQQEKKSLYLAVGDGNHSLATAKACWEELKPSLSPEEREDHPARYALAELQDLHCPALNFEPIHRLLIGAEAEELIRDFTAAVPCREGDELVFISREGSRGLSPADPQGRLPVDLIQRFLDRWLKDRPQVQIDYIHGDDTVRELGSRPGSIGIALKGIEKDSLFPGIEAGGVLPRKTFSMGHAQEKRYYMECRKIR